MAATFGTTTGAKRRLRSEMPTVTAPASVFDNDIDNIRLQAWSTITELLTQADQSLGTTSVPSAIVHAEDDLTASIWVEENLEKYQTGRFVEAGQAKADRLRQRALDGVSGWLKGTKGRRFFARVNDVDSAVGS